MFNNVISPINPLVPDAHYSERWDKLASLQNKLLKDSDDQLAYFHILHRGN